MLICFKQEKLPEDIYPVAPVEDKVNRIRGSCSTYNSRKNISPEVRKLSLEEVTSR